MYVTKTRGVNFWLCILTDLQNYGVRLILIVRMDGLKSIPNTIASLFPDTTVRLCYHQIRSLMHYVVKEPKEFMADLKRVYKAVN